MTAPEGVKTKAKLAALVDALEPYAPETVAQALRAAGLSDWLYEALARLVAQGRLSLEDFVTAAREAQAEYEPEEPKEGGA